MINTEGLGKKRKEKNILTRLLNSCCRSVILLIPLKLVNCVVCDMKRYTSVRDYHNFQESYCLNFRIKFKPLSTKMYLSDLKTHFVPRSKHSASVLKTDNLMLYREIIAVCSQIHAKHINAFWEEHRFSEC